MLLFLLFTLAKSSSDSEISAGDIIYYVILGLFGLFFFSGLVCAFKSGGICCFCYICGDCYMDGKCGCCCECCDWCCRRLPYCGSDLYCDDYCSDCCQSLNRCCCPCTYDGPRANVPNDNTSFERRGNSVHWHGSYKMPLIKDRKEGWEEERRRRERIRLEQQGALQQEMIDTPSQRRSDIEAAPVVVSGLTNHSTYEDEASYTDSLSDSITSSYSNNVVEPPPPSNYGITPPPPNDQIPPPPPPNGQIPPPPPPPPNGRIPPPPPPPNSSYRNFTRNNVGNTIPYESTNQNITNQYDPYI